MQEASRPTIGSSCEPNTIHQHLASHSMNSISLLLTVSTVLTLTACPTHPLPYWSSNSCCISICQAKPITKRPTLLSYYKHFGDIIFIIPLHSLINFYQVSLYPSPIPVIPNRSSADPGVPPTSTRSSARNRQIIMCY